MRAILLNPPGSSDENMVLTEVPEVEAGPGEMVVAVAFGGLNFADTMMRHGTYPHPKGYPLVAGVEVAGTVIAIGSGVADFVVGDRVAAFSEEAGGFAERCVVRAERTLKLPDAMTLEQGAASMIQALTAYHMLHSVSVTKPNDTILVHAIGGGVGLYLTQLAVRAGATVIGTVGTKGKERRPLEYGAAKVINRGEEDFVAAVAEFTKGEGVDKIIDSTGGSILDASFATIRKLGHVVSFGEAEGRPQANLWERLVSKSLTFTRFHLGHMDFNSEAWRKAASEVMQAVADGSLQVPIEGVYAFEDVHAMYAKLESRQVSGKLLLAVAEHSGVRSA
jgi:NADPH2:quinone reductase